MTLRSFRNLLWVVWVPIIALIQIWPKANETWQNQHTAYIFYYAVGPLIACWFAFWYLEYTSKKSSKVVAVIISTIVAATVLLLSFFGVNYMLPERYGIGLEILGVLMLNAIILAGFVIGAIFTVRKTIR